MDMEYLKLLAISPFVFVILGIVFLTLSMIYGEREKTKRLKYKVGEWVLLNGVGCRVLQKRPMKHWGIVCHDYLVKTVYGEYIFVKKENMLTKERD